MFYFLSGKEVNCGFHLILRDGISTEKYLLVLRELRTGAHKSKEWWASISDELVNYGEISLLFFTSSHHIYKSR